MTTEPAEQSEIELFIEHLRGSPRERVLALQALSRTPVPDRRLLAICESLLDDKTMALISLPYSFGEVRWCAADAVASLRRVLNISEPVVMPDVFAPVSMDKAIQLVKDAGVKKEGGVDGTIEALEVLAKMGRLPRRRITRTPE